MCSQVIALLAKLQGDYLMHFVCVFTACFFLKSSSGRPAKMDGMTHMAGRGSSILSVGCGAEPQGPARM